MALLKRLEVEARSRGIKSITLSTKSYQAKDFYLKAGYQIYATLENVPQAGITKYHFIKWLSE
jgi:ribosomal protein S18 acetylase RimI-like enzyme